MPSAMMVAPISAAKEISARASARLGRSSSIPRVQRHVDLDRIGTQEQDVAQAGEAGSRIVDRHAHALRTESVEGAPDRVVVVDRRVLGDLDDDAPAPAR
jgi:ABC-type enterochelin transport system substrate-binding protein